MKISIDLKKISLVTFIIGFIAHGFCYTNLFPVHDFSGYYYKYNIFDEVTASRWLVGLFRYKVDIPWLNGIASLALISVACYLVCSVLEVENQLFKYFIAGIMVTAPTVTASNNWIAGVLSFFLALFFSCLAVYVYYRYKNGWIWMCICVFFCCSFYAAYISVIATLFLMCSIKKLLTGQRNWKITIIDHLKMIIGGAIGAGVELIVCNIVVKNLELEMQPRVTNAINIFNDGIFSLWSAFISTSKETIKCFLPSGNISFFQNIKIYYISFILIFLCSLALFIYMICKMQVDKKAISIGLIIMDLLLMPLAIDLIKALWQSHWLMRYAYIMPGIFCIIIIDIYIGKYKAKMKFLKSIVVLYSTLAIIVGCILANTAYTKQYVNYNAAISLVNRIVDNIEEIDGYTAGQTKVLFAGRIPEPQIETYGSDGIVLSLTGVNDNTALTYMQPFIKYINQHLGANMVILNSLGDSPYNNIDTCMKILDDNNISYPDTARATIESLASFPKKEYTYYWIDYGKVLVYCIGEVE